MVAICAVLGIAHAKDSDVVRIQIEIVNHCPNKVMVGASNGFLTQVFGGGEEVTSKNMIVKPGKLSIFNQWTKFFEEANCHVKIPKGKHSGRVLVSFKEGRGDFSCNPVSCVFE